ncbi:energy-coupling factor ABC transporter permease [Anaerocolumna chitinilytica]|uniref:Cobalamin biosynthesis protein CbiM n=1 Tax=Anaerocolumna chitinilytica TaxID=1727145 RepID=A0A7M3SBA8_9FIRM|nr:energy-coupling factor ABC transporter permease [Anaerocolumna chitinilytica]BCK01876.1 cobalamin biosynthesis protein CbiM [Anaerocolumna chitinilytica]
MHMADALIAPAVAATMYAASGVTTAYSIKKVRLENDPKKIPTMGIMSAFVFAAQMINFTIPGTGSSGHLCGGLLLSILLGPYAGFLSMVSVLLIQCLLFADGGLLALGANIWNMAFYGCFVGYLLIYRPLTGKTINKKSIMIASVLGSVISLQLGAFSVTLETLFSGITALSFGQFLALMQPIHLAIGTVEGLITGAVVIFLYNTRPELIQKGAPEGSYSFKKVMVIMGIAVLLIGGGLSLAASQHPDGLEWSIEKITGNTELAAKDTYSDAVQSAEKIQEKTAILPDYSFPDSNSPVGTSFSGIIGAGIVAVLTIGCGVLFKMFRRKDSTAE